MLRSGVGFLFGCVLLVSAAVAGQEPAYTADSLALLRHAIQRHPDDFAAHERFVDYTIRAAAARSGSDDQRARALALGALGAQYAAWAKAFPRSPGIPYGMGFAFSEAQDPRAKPYLVRATGLDPKLGRAFALLAEDASRWGDDRAALAFAERAAA